MLLPGLSQHELGEIAETFVKYKLERWGEVCLRPTAKIPYDLLVMAERPIKIQVKSTNFLDGYSYKFKTCHRGTKTPYKKGDFDIFAFVALDIERVVFHPFTDNLTVNRHPSEFEEQDIDYITWCQVLDSVLNP